MFRKLVLGAVISGAILEVSCATATDPAADNRSSSDAIVRSVIPLGGASGVDPAAPITVVFNHPMPLGSEALIILHEGSITGPVVPGTATWSSALTQFTFTPAAPLKAHATYVLHFSPNLEDAGGNLINWGRCAGAIGGQSIPPGTFHGGMMGSGMGPWMNGPGWQPASGMWGYGMSLTFTTA